MRWIVDEDRAGERLDLFLVGQTELTRSRIAGLIREGACLVEGEKAPKAGLALKKGSWWNWLSPNCGLSACLPRTFP